MSKGWSSPGLAALEKALYRIETGRVVRPDDFYTRLLCEAFGKSTRELFGDLDARALDREASVCGLRSHKFIPIFVGPDVAAKLVDSQGMNGASDQWVDCHRAEFPLSDAQCTLYSWPFGVVMYHLVEDRPIEQVAELAVWRRSSYEENMSWAQNELRRLTGVESLSASYVLSLYWLDNSVWSGIQLETALRMMCMPRVLLERDDVRSDTRDSFGHATLIEQALLREGFNHPEMVDFGIKGISHGFASWSGVVYHPVAPERGLSEQDLVACELTVQAIWAYCDYIRGQLEKGLDPEIPPEFGWRFLRGIRSRVTTERPRETSQHRAMREAVVETSGLARHLSQAVETLRECEGQ
ncbi:hypothetical protein AB0D33_09670 [Streptomyces sp. NPDC048404]|uniref:hypothetical protein n=1 Tax=unclassified Streptomyces TaxID=2593676 RepID=UPI00342D8B5E